MACIHFVLEQGCPDPVVEGCNPASFSFLPGRKPFQVGSQVNPMTTWLDRNPGCIVAVSEWVWIPLLERLFLIDLCVISNQHGLTMPMHALYSTQGLEL